MQRSKDLKVGTSAGTTTPLCESLTSTSSCFSLMTPFRIDSRRFFNLVSPLSYLCVDAHSEVVDYYGRSKLVIKLLHRSPIMSSTELGAGLLFAADAVTTVTRDDPTVRGRVVIIGEEWSGEQFLFYLAP